MQDKKIINASRIKHIVLLIVYFGIIIALRFEATAVFLLKFFPKSFLIKYINLIIYGILFILSILFFYKYLFNALKDFKNNFKSYIKLIGKYLLISYGLTLLCGIILTIFHIGSSANNDAIIEYYKAYGFLMVIDTCLIGPICEEVIFRGILLDFFKGKTDNKIRIVVSLILSTLIFALMHCDTYSLYDILSNVPIFTMGCVLASLYIKTDNIICSTCQHMIINTISTIIIFTALI